MPFPHLSRTASDMADAYLDNPDQRAHLRPILADSLEDMGHPHANAFRSLSTLANHRNVFLKRNGMASAGMDPYWSHQWMQDFEEPNTPKNKPGHEITHAFIKDFLSRPERYINSPYQAGPSSPRQGLARRGQRVRKEVKADQSITVPESLSSAGAQYWLPSNLKLEHEKRYASNAKKVGPAVEQMTPMSSILQSTVAGRHGRHWYDENHEVAKAAVSHQADQNDFNRLVGLEAATSPNAAIDKNQNAAYDIYRLWNMGPRLGNLRIAPRSTNANHVQAMIQAYAKGEGLFFPDDHQDPDLRGQPVMRHNGESSPNKRRKWIRTNEGEVPAPLVYPNHIPNSVNALLHPENFSDPNKTGILGTRKPQKADSFLRNKLGNHEAVTVDRHEGRGWGFRDKGPMAIDKPHIYHFLVAAGRHVARLLNNEAFNPNSDHPVFGQGWTPARGQAARWHTMRALRDRIVKGQTPEQAALGLTAREVHEGSSFLHLFTNPDYMKRIKTMISEGHLAPSFLADVNKIEDKYRPNKSELDEVVGHKDLIPVARHIAAHVKKRPAKNRNAGQPTLFE